MPLKLPGATVVSFGALLACLVGLPDCGGPPSDQGSLRSDFPSIKGLVWFDIKKERDWEINSSAASLAAYVTMAKDPFMNP